MLRHTVLFIHRDTATDDQKLAMLRGLAYLRMECPEVRAGDYGPDLLGGSSPLLAVPPWKRPPLWRRRGEGPRSNYDVALHLDFDDDAALARYFGDERARAVARFNASVSVGELTARVDWRYDGPPLVSRGRARHTALFVWADGAAPGGRVRAFDAARELRRAPGVAALTIGEGIGTSPADFDWALDLQFRDAAAAQDVVGGDVYAKAMAAVAAATKYEWTARVTHVMRGF